MLGYGRKGDGRMEMQGNSDENIYGNKIQIPINYVHIIKEKIVIVTDKKEKLPMK